MGDDIQVSQAVHSVQNEVDRLLGSKGVDLGVMGTQAHTWSYYCSVDSHSVS
jgi:hypothetical protein